MHEADVLVRNDEGVAERFISIIIPALNEADCIAATLDAVHSQQHPHEIIVVDGGSTDGTPSLASVQAHVITSPRGRALQMNRGAAAARGDILLFLHADTLLRPGTLNHVSRSIEKGAEGGAFRLAFDQWTPLLRFYSFCTRFPVPCFCFGDRALFVRRDVFEEVGGYREIPLFEDLELARMLAERGKFRFLPEYVITSSRRFLRHGPLRQQLRNTYLWLHYVAGRDPRKLEHLYRYD